MISYPPMIWITTFFLTWIFTIQNSNAINCFICTSVNGSNPYCEDPINTAVVEYREKCSVPKKGHIGLFPANFCIKIIGKNTETYEKLVIRACGMKTMDSQCGMFRYQDQAMTGCVLTCDYNGCNDSEKLFSFIHITSYLLITNFLLFLGFC